MSITRAEGSNWPASEKSEADMMWRAITAFFRSPVGKVGGVAIKTGHVVVATAVIGTAAVAGTAAYLRQANSPTSQQVVVFLSGLNTSMTNCYQDAFYDDTHNQ